MTPNNGQPEPISNNNSIATQDPETTLPENEYLDQFPDEVEMSIFDHLEELRLRIFYY